MEKDEERKKQARLAKARMLASLVDSGPNMGQEDDLNIAEYDDEQKIETVNVIKEEANADVPMIV